MDLWNGIWFNPQNYTTVKKKRLSKCNKELLIHQDNLTEMSVVRNSNQNKLNPKSKWDQHFESILLTQDVISIKRVKYILFHK